MFVVLLAGLSACSAFSQITARPGRRQPPVIVWDGNTLGAIEGSGQKIHTVSLDSGERRTFSPPVGTLRAYLWGGTVHAIRLVDQNFFYTFRNPDGSWSEAQIEFNPGQCGHPATILPSDKPDWFFAMNVDTGFVVNGEASCCAWWRRSGDGKLRLEELIPIEWEGPAFIPFRIEGNARFAIPTPFRPGLIPILDAPIRVPGAIIVVSLKAGILWVIKDGMPFPTRVVDLNGIGKEFIKGKHPFPDIILGLQPLRNGHLLIAKRSLRAVEETHKSFLVEPIGPVKMNYELARREWDVATTAFPEIEWVDLDPLTGQIEKPDGLIVANAPIQLKTYREALGFSFGFDANEALVIPWKDPESAIGRESQSPPPPQGKASTLGDGRTAR